jgi:NAD(P)H-dependent flavin oxidoreductase YrpB (nitropropane dioxygenase family)
VRTRLTELLGIDAPIVLAPMGGATTPVLAAAVANAGGLGLLPLSWSSPREIAALLAETFALTDRPVGVNLILEWDQRERLHAALEAGARVVSFFWGDPSPLMAEAKAAGATILVTVGSAAEASRAVAAGADVVVAQGWEAGGHVWSAVSTMALVPRVVDAVSPVPVVAAGGIADGRGLAAALALGAAGAWVGTRFLAASEAGIHDDYRRRLIAAVETDTVHGTLFDGGWPNAPHRTLRNSTVDAWEAAGRPAPGARPGEGDTPATGPDGTAINRYASTTPRAGATGDTEPLANWSGQGVGLVARVQPAADIVRELVADAEAVLAGLRAP